MRKASHLEYPLDRLFSVSTHMPILRALKDSREGMSGRAIARRAEINHQACAVAIRNLEFIGVLQRQGSGKTQLVRLNSDSHLVREIVLPLLEKESGFLNLIRHDIAKTFRGEAAAVTVFGSVARKQDLPGSDMDVLILVEGSRKDRVSEKAASYGSDFIRHYGVRLSPIVLSVHEARQRLKKGDALVINIFSEGVDLLDRKAREVISWRQD
jgi:predicted nucleotidyltransferase